MDTTNFLIFLLGLTFSKDFALAEENKSQDKYYVEAFTQNNDSQVLILKLKPVEGSQGFRFLERVRQDEDLEEDPTTTPFFPQIIPGITKIFSGLFAGDLTQIFHGTTSNFAPTDVKNEIDSVYNAIVGFSETTPATNVKPTAPVLAVNSTEKAVTSTEITTPTTTAEVEIAKIGDEDDNEEVAEDPDFVVKIRGKF